MNDSLLAMPESRECGRRRVAAAVSAASHSRCHADLPSHLNTAASTRATLSRIQYAELANRAGDRIGGDASCNKRTLLEKWKLNLNFKFRAAQRRSVKHNGNNCAIGIDKWNA